MKRSTEQGVCTNANAPLLQSHERGLECWTAKRVTEFCMTEFALVGILTKTENQESIGFIPTERKAEAVPCRKAWSVSGLTVRLSVPTA